MDESQDIQMQQGYSEGEISQMSEMKSYFSQYWREFLLISINPTTAATEALQLIANNQAKRQLLDSKQEELKRIEQVLIQPILLENQNDKELLCAVVQQELVPFFSNFYALNKVFFTDSGIPSQESPCIDFDIADKFFQNLSYILDVHFSEGDNLLKSVFQSIQVLLENLQKHLSHNPQCFADPVQLRFFLFILGLPLFDVFATDSVEILSEVHRLYAQLSSKNHEVLINWYKNLPVGMLRQLVTITQQQITLTVFRGSASDVGLKALRDTEAPKLRHAFVILKDLYIANKQRQIRLDTSLEKDVVLYQLTFDREKEDDLLTPLTLSDFYNDAVNAADTLLRFDFLQWERNETLEFDLVGNSFILDTATKAWYLLGHAILNQYVSGREPSIQFLGMAVIQPYLLLRVRRSELVYDALRKLTSKVAEGDLRKQLRVIFDEEEAVDEGGVTKEFFQLLVEQLFNPDYGMFTYNEDTHLFWFSPHTFEHNLQFELIGVVLGLAIYNGVILDIHFPLVVYKKLLGDVVGLRDLRELEPQVEESLRKLLLMSEEEVIKSDLTFSVDVIEYGVPKTIQLCEECEPDHPVTIHNRQSYVETYVDWVLNRSIQSQFNAFHRGFMKCCGETIKKLSLQAEELFTVICGSNEFDSEALEQITKYRDGYTGDEQTIRDFWEVIHSLSHEDQKRLLFFVTGSDRIPVKGLSSLQFFIGRAGSETEKIPTAHTCYNYLLLPDYKDKEKLRKYLMIALQYHKGFGLR